MLYIYKNDVDWLCGLSCIFFDMFSLYLSMVWKLNKILWFFWGKKLLFKMKVINWIYFLICRIILCLKLKKKCVFEKF